MSEPDDLPVGIDELLRRALTELEQGWADGPGPSVEELLNRFPRLKGLPPAVCRLIDAESRQRTQRGEKPEPDEYHRRFPELADALRELLTHDSAPAELFRRPVLPAEPPGLMLALKLRCPHCRNPIEVVDEVCVESDISCPSCGSSFRLASAEQTLTYRPEKGATVGHFELTEKVGAGAFGSVWKARDTELQRTVAVKIPRASGLDADDLDRFLREARAAAQLRHPNIVSVHEVGRDDQTSYIASEFIDGLTLADWLTGQRLSFREAVELCATMADALQHAHAAGIVHRDLKPGNIMLDQEGRPHLMDFGLAKRDAGEITMTIDGHILGTPAYMSPEQAKGDSHHADRRSDLYSLGAVFFELLTGERPFRGNSRMLIHQVIHEEAPSPRKLNGAVPRDLETICLKCLEKEPGKRFQSTQELAEELRRWLNGEPIRSRPLGTAARVWRWSKRKPAQATALLLLMLLTIGSLSAAALFYDMHEKQARLAQEMATLAEEKAQLAEEKTQLAEEKDSETAKALTAVGEKEQALGLLQEETRKLTEQRELADRRAAEAEEQRQLAARKSADLEDQLYQNKIARAAGAIEGGWYERASQILQSIESSKRGWEAAFLARRVQGSPLTIYGRTGSVWSVSFSPDGRRIVTGSWDGTAKIWDAETGEEVVDEAVPDGLLEELEQRLSPDGLTQVIPQDAELLLIRKNPDYDPWAEDAARRQYWDPIYHEQDATEAERAQDWFAARFHLRWLVEHAPENEAFKTRLAVAEANWAADETAYWSTTDTGTDQAPEAVRPPAVPLQESTDK